MIEFAALLLVSTLFGGMMLSGIPQMAPELGWILAFYGAFSKTEVRSGRLPSTRAARTVVEGLI